MRRLLVFSSALLFVSVILFGAHSTTRPHAADSADLRRVQAVDSESRVLDFLAAANLARTRAGVPKLTVHPELQVVLDDYTRRGVEGGLEGAFRFAGQRIPAVRALAGNLIHGATDQRLFAEFGSWNDVLDAGYTHLAVDFFDDPGQSTPGCIVVLATVFPEFRPPMSSQGVSGFYNVCRWCGRGHGVSVLGGGQTTLVIQCPDCRRANDLVATDSEGNWRRASQFLQPIQRRESEAEAALGLTDVMQIWTGLVSHNRYQKDAERIGGADSWNLPEETLRRGAGDCEDTSLALAQLLLERGYEVRVVLGKHKGQGHAWCVLRWQGQSYLLETTASRLPAERPPLISELAFDYEPEYQFDAARMYFKNFEGWTAEYWSESNWSTALAEPQLNAAL